MFSLPPLLNAEVLEPSGVIHVNLGQLVTETTRFNFNDTQQRSALTEEFPDDLLTASASVQLAWWRGPVELGWETGVFANWNSEETDFTVSDGAGSTATTLAVESEFSTLALSMGLYLSSTWSEHVRFYVGAGPMLSMGFIDIKHARKDASSGDWVISDGSSSLAFEEDSEFTGDFGYYGRAGIDFYSHSGFGLGLSVRYVDSQLDFDDTFGEVNIEGVQYALSITKKF
ncbi:MAG: hypothetical protein P8Y45_08835 [Exilibacterium sp.]